MVSWQESEYPGVAQLVGRDIWECVDPIHARLGQKPGRPYNTGDSGFSSGCRKRHKSGFDHRNDHRQKNFIFTPRRGIMAEIEYPGVAQLVGRDIWDVEVGCSSHLTRTKIPLKLLISEGFSYSLSIAAQTLNLLFLTYNFDKCRLNIVIFAEVQYN